MVGAIYLARGAEGGYELAKFDASVPAFQTTGWPAHLTSLKDRMVPRVSRLPAGDSDQETQIISLTMPAMATDTPVLVIPAHERPALPAPGHFAIRGGGRVGDAGAPTPSAKREVLTDMLVSLRIGRDFVIVELDPGYLKSTVVPALVERHFAGTDEEGHGDAYLIAVLSGTGTPLYTRGLPTGASMTADQADVATDFFSVRFSFVQSMIGSRQMFAWSTETTRTDATSREVVARPATGAVAITLERNADAPMRFETLMHPTNWRLLVQHSAGSLDAAVAQARRRNLWLSFGILSVLAMSVGLIVFNARRSERLAGQQMDFVATVSHELRTPLAVIRSAAQNLSAGVIHDASQARRYGDLIEGEGRRLTDMVEQVLEYAGLSGNRRPARARPIDPGPVVRDAIDACAPRCDEQGVSVEVDIPPSLPAVAVDEDALRRALDNLVANALKYAPEGRWLGVTVRRAAMKGGEEIQVAVSDRGRGIEPEDLAHIFEPFYRGRYAIDRQIHGNGLGLSLVRRIAEAHGGRVSVKSARGEGTTFTIHLPAVAADRAVQPLGEPATDAGSRQT
jgi:signal transduction histidine kinase